MSVATAQDMVQPERKGFYRPIEQLDRVLAGVLCCSRLH